MTGSTISERLSDRSASALKEGDQIQFLDRHEAWHAVTLVAGKYLGLPALGYERGGDFVPLVVAYVPRSHFSNALGSFYSFEVRDVRRRAAV